MTYFRFKSHGNYIILPNQYPVNSYPGRLSGYPAPPSGKLPYPVRIHPATFTYNGGAIGYPNLGQNYISANSIYSSPNEVTAGLPFQDTLEWDMPLDKDVCTNLKGLTKSQLHICRK